MIEYNGKQFNEDYEGLKSWAEEKLWNLHKEETEWQKENKKEIEKIKKPKRTKREQELIDGIHKWNQQVGKIIFISGVLKEFYGDNTLVDAVWDERGWELSEDGNKIIKK